MLFRFLSALTLVVLVSLAGTSLEKKNLELRRAVTSQSYQREILREQLARGHLRIQEVSSPTTHIDDLDVEPAPESAPKASRKKSHVRAGATRRK